MIERPVLRLNRFVSLRAAGRRKSIRAFTLIELVVVIALLGLILTLVGFRSGTFSFWREEGFIRRLSEVVTFLHHQAVADQAFYRLELDMTNPDNHRYSVGILKAEYENEDTTATAVDAGVGQLTSEIANFLSPSIAEGQNMVPPPSLPSLAEPVELPKGMYFEDVRTMRGMFTESQRAKPYVLFSPRGFSEFAVFHLHMSSDQSVTILINPFTGTTETYREYKDFKWTYGSKNKRDKD